MARLPAGYVEGWPEENAIYRTARKSYRCRGAGNIPPKTAPACVGTITPGVPYVEYVGETPAYARGSAHCVPCALEFGFIKRAEATP